VPRGSISYSDVPHRRSRLAPFEAPAVAAGNLLVAGALFAPWHTARVRWTRPLDEVTRDARTSGRPLVYYSWHAYEPFLLLAMRDVPESLMPYAVGHDGFRSRLLQRAAAAYGFRVWVYRRRSPVSPTQQIIGLLERGGTSASLVADAGGAPRVVRPGFCEVMRTVRAHLVPIVVRARPRLSVGRPWEYGVPLPFSRVEVHVGDPLDGRAATPESCREGLEALERAAG